MRRVLEIDELGKRWELLRTSSKPIIRLTLPSDKEADPLRWADVHEPLAEFLLDHAKLDRADELVSDIIDIREDYQGENHPALAKTLLLWGNPRWPTV
jgi:hypothetical protein